MAKVKAKREGEVVFLSDIHLGTYGCHATESVSYTHLDVYKRQLISAFRFSS